jgi:lipopolysaccharide transport system ATP-binding protein
LESGKIKLDTDPTTAIKEYYESISAFSTAEDLSSVPRAHGHYPVIQKIVFYDRKGNSISSVQTGDALTARIYYNHSDIIKDAHFGLLFETFMGIKIFYVHSKIQKGLLPDLSASGIIECEIPRLPLVAGTYYVNAGCGSQRKHLDYIERACQLQVTEADVFGTGRTPDPNASLIFVDAKWEVIEGLQS